MIDEFDELSTTEVLTALNDLGATKVQFRRGVVSQVSPLQVKLGGSTAALSVVAVLNPMPLALGDSIAALQWAGDCIVLGAIGTPAVRFAGVGTVFPTSPADGDTFIYNADTTNGVKWMFQYRAAGGTHKWEFIGGAPLYAEVTTNQTLAAGAGYQALTTAGPSLTAPLAGDFDVEIGATAFNPTAAFSTWMSYDIGVTGAVDADAVVVGAPNATDAAPFVAASRLRRKAGLAASTALVSKYKRDGGTGNWGARWMRVTPVRVSG